MINLSMKLQFALILFSATVFGLTLANCTTEERSTMQSKAIVAKSDLAEQQPAWKEMDREQRVQYMRTVVLPQMRQTFAEFNSEKFGRINCKTCHGDGATNESFKMPNPQLPKLPATTEGFQELMKKDSAIMNFMMHKVKPQMAQLLGMSEFDPKSNPEGFGCFNCHTMKK
jgi:hypothetical protein